MAQSKPEQKRYVIVFVLLLLGVATHLYRTYDASIGDFMNTYLSSNDVFDYALWKAQRNNRSRDNPRIGMVTTLERLILRTGMSRSEVQKALGPPDQIRGSTDVYELGASPFGVDYEQYFIEYNERQKVIRFFLRRG